MPSIAPLVNGWQYPAETMGVYGNHYLKRAALAMVGLGSNPPEDAIYPLAFTDGDGSLLHGHHRYWLHFDAHQLPPVGAFWSLTLYDQDGFQVPNPLNRCALGDRDPLRYNDDGSLDLMIQHQDPATSEPRTGCPVTAWPVCPVPTPLRTESDGARRHLETTPGPTNPITQPESPVVGRSAMPRRGALVPMCAHAQYGGLSQRSAADGAVQGELSAVVVVVLRGVVVDVADGHDVLEVRVPADGKVHGSWSSASEAWSSDAWRAPMVRSMSRSVRG